MRRDFPPNLYENRGYFTYRNPVTKDEFGFGTDRKKAFNAAIECNIKLAQQMGRESLVDKVFGGTKRTVAQWEERYQAILAKHELTPATRCNYRTFSRHVVRILNDKPIKAVTALNVSDGLETLAPGVAKAVRAYMKLSFAESFVQGWIDANPVRETRLVAAPAVKRARLTLDVFKQVYDSAPTEWLRNAMALALTSAQRREDVARAEFKDFHDGGWWLTQASEKTDHPHRIFIPDGLRPSDFPLSLADVLGRCRRSGVVSRYLVHQTKIRGTSKSGGRLRLSTVSRAFSDAVAALGADWGDKTPPTFHEIRSLALRLYGDQGVNVQMLAGHSDPDTTAIYLNSRGQEYARVLAGTV